MLKKPLLGLLFLLAFTGTAALHAQNPADPSTASGDGTGSQGKPKGGGQGKPSAPDASAQPAVCTVRPGSGNAGAAEKSDAASKSGAGKESGAASVQVNQYAAAQPNAAGPQNAQQKKPKTSAGGDSSTQTGIWIIVPASAGQSSPQNGSVTIPAFPPNTINAAEIAPRLAVLSPRILEATAVSSSKIVLIVNTKPSSAAGSRKTKGGKPARPAGPPPDPELSNLQSSLGQLANELAFTSTVDAASTPSLPNDSSGRSPRVFPVTLKSGTGKACDIANALVDASPYINEITAVDDTRLLISLSGSTPDFDSVRKGLEALTEKLSNPLTAASPRVETVVHRLYYNHDPRTVATIISDAYPNIVAQPVSPDLVVLSDPADIDDDVRRSVIDSAERAIARIDQPHPQVSVDAWALQLTTKNADDLAGLIPKLEDLADGYNHAIDESLGNGWKYLSSRLASQPCLDPLMTHYLTWSTQISRTGAIQRVEQPYSAALAKEHAEPGYGLGYATLYYPLTPNLVDMLVTLISLCDPGSAAVDMFNAMGWTPSLSSRNTCREEDEEAYNTEVYGDEKDRAAEVKNPRIEDRGPGRFVPTPPHPKHLQLSCVRHAIVDGVLARAAGNQALSTSNLGQLRAALVDFLFHYKLMVQYPDDFHFYYEPVAADTLDSALSPIVTAFDEDISVFQASLQGQVADTIKREKKDITYGYGGLVSLKVISTEPGTVNTSTQNYFDATPPATLNDLLANLQAEGASTAKHPLSSLVTSLAPEKAVELMTVLGQTLMPKATTAHIGRGLDLEVTAHTLSGAIGAELDLKVQSTENGAGIIQAGSAKPTDDLNSRVSQHSVDTHVRVDSINLFRVSTLSSTLARGQEPWKPFDPIELPALGYIFKVPRSPKTVHTQSLVFVDAIIVPTAADLGYGVPTNGDEYQPASTKSGESIPAQGYKILHSFKDFPAELGPRLLQYHQKIVDCLNREYIGSDGLVHVQGNGADNHVCRRDDYQLNSLESYDWVE